MGFTASAGRSQIRLMVATLTFAKPYANAECLMRWRWNRPRKSGRQTPIKFPCPSANPLAAPGNLSRWKRCLNLQNLDELARSLPPSVWQTVTWRLGTKGPQRSRFAKVKVWAAHGWKAQRHPERAAEWLLVEWPEGAPSPSDYWLADLGPQPVGLRRLVRTARSRWRVELNYGNSRRNWDDHYEGRHWLGWHHHVTLVCGGWFAESRSSVLVF